MEESCESLLGVEDFLRMAGHLLRNRLRRGHRPQEGPDYRRKTIRLVILKPVASILYLFDLKARVQLLQLSRRFKGNNTVVPDH